jgi:hypothetical protein
MAFNINEFKSNINRFGGFAHPGLFQVTFTNTPPVTSNAEARDLTFFCQAVTTPGLSVNTATYEAVAQRPKVFPMSMNSEPVNAIFMLDSNHQILAFLHGWMQKVINYSTAGGDFAEIDEQLPYEMGYKDEYACRMTIRHYSTHGDGQTYYETILDNAFPVVIGDIDLDWAQKDGYATVAVGFAYDRIQYSGERAGVPTTRLNRGLGLLDLITSIGVISQTFDLGFRPQSVQDAINRFTSVKNAFDTIGDFFRSF